METKPQFHYEDDELAHVQFNSIQQERPDKTNGGKRPLCPLCLGGAYDFIAENKRIAIIIAESQAVMERKRYRSFDSPGKWKFQFNAVLGSHRPRSRNNEIAMAYRPKFDSNA